MSTVDGGSGDQASTSGQTTGQAPQANNTPTTPQGQAPEGHITSQASTSLSPADYERIISDLRKEAAGHRTGKAELEKQLKQYQDAQLTTEQKREREFADLQAKSFEYETKLQQQALRIAGYEHGATLGISDIKAALALVQVEHGHELKYGEDGTPENIADLLKAVLKEHPMLAGGTQRQQQAATASSGGATNPGRQAGNGGLTLEMIKAMPMRERIARMSEIQAWEKANVGKQ